MSGVETIYPGASLAAGGGSGDVVGPASSLDGELVLFDGMTGTLLKGGGVPPVYLGAMTWAALQASAYANGSVGLAALDADAQVSITDLSDTMLVMTPSADRTYWTTGGFFTFSARGLTTLNSFAASTSRTWTLAANPGNGKTRITASGTHGMTAAVNGKCVYISAWSGSGAATGLYTLTYVDDTNIDLTVAYGAGYGNPTLSAAGSDVELLKVTVPAKLLQLHSTQRISTQWKHTNSSNNHRCRVKMGGQLYLTMTPSGVAGLTDMRQIHNVGSKSAQIAQHSNYGSFSGGTPTTSTVNTDSAFDIAFNAYPDNADEFVELSHYRIEIQI